MATSMDQDPDALLDIVLRMDPTNNNDLLASPFRDTDTLNGPGAYRMPVYTELSNSVFDDIDTAPHLTDLNGLIDIDNLPQVPFIPDAVSLPQQGSDASGLEWSRASYGSSTQDVALLCSLNGPTELQTLSQRPIQAPLSYQPSVVDASTHRTLPNIQFINMQHLNLNRQQHPHAGISALPIKPKTRRRVTTAPQRKAANVRERRRMFNLNEAFDVLRKTVPTFAYEKRLSRIETLRLAMLYITFMGDVLSGKRSDDGNLKKLLESGNFAGLTNSSSGTGHGASVLHSAASRINRTSGSSIGTGGS